MSFFIKWPLCDASKLFCLLALSCCCCCSPVLSFFLSSLEWLCKCSTQRCKVARSVPPPPLLHTHIHSVQSTPLWEECTCARAPSLSPSLHAPCTKPVTVGPYSPHLNPINERARFCPLLVALFKRPQMDWIDLGSKGAAYKQRRIWVCAPPLSRMPSTAMSFYFRLQFFVG